MGKTVPKDAGAAIDMWSVGVLFLELLLNDQNHFRENKMADTRVAISRLNDEDIARVIQTIQDEVARDLLQNLLRTDYRKRMTALKALLHPYFGVDCSQFPVDRIP
jgi:serine/threonine protein kinase